MCKTSGYKKNWYKEWFGEEYLTVYEHRDEQDAKDLVNLILTHIPVSASTRILDVACGAGRHAGYFAGITPHVFGIDLSKHLLDQARPAGKPPYFIRGDMRRLPVRKPFDLIFSLFTSFGYFEDDETNRNVAVEMSRVLKKNGHIVIDYLNPEYVASHLVPEGERMAGDLCIFEKRWIEKDRVHKQIRLNSNGDDKIFYESVRLFSAGEMRDILNRAGIRIRNVFGEYNGRPFEKDSSRMIIFGRKE